MSAWMSLPGYDGEYLSAEWLRRVAFAVDAVVAVVVARLVQGARRVGRARGELADAVEADVKPAVEDGGDGVGGKGLNVGGGVGSVSAGGVAARQRLRRGSCSAAYVASACGGAHMPQIDSVLVAKRQALWCATRAGLR